MKKYYSILIVVLLLLSNKFTTAQTCGSVYGTGYGGAGSSIGIREYNFATNLYSPASLVDVSLFTTPNTMNNGGPIAIDPLNQQINYHTDATAPRRIALFNFASTSLNIVNFPAALDAAVGEQVFCSGYKPLSHRCFYMTGSFLSTFPTPAVSAFFSIDFTNPAAPTYNIYNTVLTAGSPLVNISSGANLGADLCFDANGIGYLVTGSKQLFRLTTNETNSTAIFTFLADLSALSFSPTAVAFNPANSKLIMTGATQTVAEYNLATNVATDLTTTSGYIAPDLASCFFPNLNPLLQVTKSYFDVTQNLAPPAVIVLTNDIVEYTITVTNNGNINAGGFTITDAIPAGTTYQPSTTTLNGIAVTDAPGAIFPFATTSPASSNDHLTANGILTTVLTTGAPICTIKYKVKVIANAGAVINTVTASVAGTDPATPLTAMASVTFNANGILPLSFIDFSTNKLKNTVQLRWITSNEINNNHFEIEASSDNVTYKKIGSVLADANSSTNHNYNFIDENPTIGNNFYRIKQIDNNNKFANSEVRKIYFNKENSLDVLLFPNPAKASYVNLIVLNSFTLLQVKIYNVMGQEMLSQLFKNNSNSINLNITTLAKGVYNVVTIADSKTIKTTKLIVE
jgi:uncharacterized repeat protein (TIGR01451 family)